MVERVEPAPERTIALVIKTKAAVVVSKLEIAPPTTPMPILASITAS